MTCNTADIVIRKGSTFTKVYRWSSEPLIYKAITGITKAAPVVITAPGHGLVDGWRSAVASVVGMRQVNGKAPAKGAVPYDTEFKKVTYLTADTISLNAVNSLEFDTYVSGGTLIYYTPIDLSGYTARMHIRLTEDATGDPLVTLTTENGGIAIDNTAKTITITIAATATDDLAFLEGVYDIEMITGTTVFELANGTVTVEGETTR